MKKACFWLKESRSDERDSFLLPRRRLEPFTPALLLRGSGPPSGAAGAIRLVAYADRNGLTHRHTAVYVILGAFSLRRALRKFESSSVLINKKSPTLTSGTLFIAQKKTRTSMLLTALVPETSVSTNSTIWAFF